MNSNLLLQVLLEFFTKPKLEAIGGTQVIVKDVHHRGLKITFV